MITIKTVSGWLIDFRLDLAYKLIEYRPDADKQLVKVYDKKTGRTTTEYMFNTVLQELIDDL